MLGEVEGDFTVLFEEAPLGAVRMAYEARTGRPAFVDPPIPVVDFDDNELPTVHLSDEEVRARYPDLWHRFSYHAEKPALDPAWLRWNEGSVLKLARAIDAERTFEDLPVLADALEEAGCDHAKMLAHCRARLTHPGSCWVVNLLLGK